MREELFVKNARLRGRDALHDIHIREGKFYRVAPAAVLAAARGRAGCSMRAGGS